jgi:hypothetical protein
MKKFMIFLSIMAISLALVGCTNKGETVVPPVYQGITVNGSSPVEGDELVTHFKGKQGTILVDVAFTNPSNVAIKSININGYTYNSSRFLEGSTTTLVQLEINVGDVLEETIYSIDRFSYVNGENTVNINVTVNNKFSVYVFKDFPEIVRESYSADKTTITISFIVTDVDDIIVTNSLRAEIYDGDELKDSIQITDKDDATVVFSNLNTDKHYDVKVYGSFNRDDTNGLVEDYAFTSDTYVTLANGIPSAVINNIEIDANKVTLDVDLTDSDNVIVDGGLRVVIYKGVDFKAETYIMSDVTDVFFDDLLNDTEYTVKVIADFDLNDSYLEYTDRVLSSYTFTTLPREIPLPKIQNLSLEENSIDFDLKVENEDGIIVIESMYVNLYIKDEVGDESGEFTNEFIGKAFIVQDHVSFQISNVYSGTVFILEVVADYDLNNDAGLQQEKIIFTEEIGTQTNVVPELSTFGITVTQGYVTVDLNVSDPNNTLIGSLIAKLYERDEITGEVTELQSFTFEKTTEELVFNYPIKKDVYYYIEIFADYNLRDEDGTVRDQSLGYQVSITKEARIPVAELKDLEFSSSTIQFGVEVKDADETIIAGSTFARIYDGDEEYDVDDYLYEFELLDINEQIQFLNLFSNHKYRIDVVTKYDLDDGTTLIKESILESFEVITEVNEVPTVTLTEESVTSISVVVDSVILDPSNVVVMSSIRARIYHISDLENPVESLTLDELVENDIEFTDLYSNNDYYIAIYVHYNLRDGNGNIEDVLLALLPLKTVEKEAPRVEYGDLTTTNNELTVDIKVIDNDFVIDKNEFDNDEVIAVLFDSEGETTFTQYISTNIDQTITFTGLLSNEEYSVYVFADYNLNDDVKVYEHQVLEISDRVVTDPLEEININLNNIVSTLDSISFNIEVLDVDSVITDDFIVTLFTVVNGEIDTEIGTLPITSLVQEGLSFDSLTSDTEYRLVFTAEYSLNDKVGSVNEEIGYYNIKTKTKIPPVTNIDNISITEDALTFDLNINDQYTVLIEDTLYAELWEVDENQVATQKAKKLILTDNVSFDLTGFLANQDLEIRITGDYDLGDGNDIQEEKVFGTYGFTTVSFDAPIISIIDVVPTQNTVEAIINVRDEDSVITSNLKALLYDKDKNILKVVDLGVGVNNISFDYTMDAKIFYSVVVVADYNLRNGDETILGEIQAEKVVYMESKFLPEASITSLIPTKDSVSMIVDIYDFHEVIVAGTTVVELYHNGVLVATSDPITGLNNAITFGLPDNELFSNSDYELYVVTNYINDESVGVKTHQTIHKSGFTTKEKNFPTVNIVNLNEFLTDSIRLSVTITDNDSVIPSGSMVVKIYHRNNLNDAVYTLLVPSLTLTDHTFPTLYSNSNYVAVVTITYNMNDEQGEQTNFTLGELNIQTAEKENASVLLEYVNFEKDSVSFDVTVDDDDLITENLRVVLYDSDGETAFTQDFNKNETTTVVFNGIFSNESYTIYVYGDYDMNDQIHIYTNELLYKSSRYQSLAKKEIEIVISDEYSTLDSIVFKTYITDPDSVYIDNLKAVIFAVSDLTTPIETIDLVIGSQIVEFDNLSSDTDYRIFIYADYNLNDKDLLQTEQKIGTLALRTLTKLPPETIKSNEVLDEDQVMFDLSLDDPFGVFIPGTMTATLLKDGKTLLDDNPYKLVLTDNVSFDLREFLSDYEFEIVITGSYNLGDSNGVQTGEFGRYTFRTLAKSVPSIEESIVNVTQETVTTTFAIDDNNQTISSDIIIRIYQQSDLDNETPLETITIDKINSDSYTRVHTYSFNQSLEVGEAYLITVTTSYDLNDGTGEQTEVVLFEQFIYLDNKLAPEAKITDVTHTEDSITVTVDIIDGFATIIPGTTVVDLKLDGEVVQTSAAISGTGTVVTFNGLISNLEYTYSVRTDYDKDGNVANGITSDANITVTENNTVSTTPKQVLNGDVTIVDQTTTSIVIDITVVDDDAVREANSLTLYVYRAGNLVTPVHTLNLTTLTYDNYIINGLDSDNSYVFVLQADYDLDEDEDPIIVEDYVLDEVTDRTIAREDISATVDYTSLVGTTLTIDVTITDPDNTLTGNLKVVLYDSEGVTIHVYDQTDGLVVGLNPTITFTGLLNDEPYYVYVIADYDLYDTVNTFTDEVLVIGDKETTNALDRMSGSITNVTSDLTSIEFDVNVEDSSSVYTDTLKAVLYLTSDLLTPVGEVGLNVGTTHVVFDSLNTDASYTIKLVTNYNLNSKAGEYTNQLLDVASITTLIKVAPTVEVTNLQITESKVSFILSVNDQFDVYQENSLTAELWVDDTFRQSKDLTTDIVSFDLSSFLANQKFEIRISGDYDLDDGLNVVTGQIGTITGNTVAYDIPTGEITNVEVHQNTVDLEVFIDDLDETITTNLTAVLKTSGGATVEVLSLTRGLNVTAFTATLEPQQLYTIYIMTNYNLRDGAGDIGPYVLQEYVLYVDNELTPEGAIRNESFDKTSISVTVDVFDDDTTINGLTVAKLYLDGIDQNKDITITASGQVVTFNTLLSNREYYVKVVTAYNNNSGIGDVVNYQLASTYITTNPKEEAIFDVELDTVTSNEIIYDIIITDNDSVTGAMEAVLYDNLTEVGRETVVDNNNINVTFSGLTGATTYELVIEYVNNLNDGLGDIDTELVTRETTTEDTIVPEASLTVIPTTNSLAVTYTILDEDSAISLSELVLYLDDVEQPTRITISGTGTHTFTNLIHNRNYRVEIEATYNLNDLNGNQTSVLIFDDTDTTSLISINDEVIDSRNNTLNVGVNDSFDQIKSAFLIARLVRDGKTVATYVVVEDIETTIDMFNILSEYTYTLEIVADVDYGTGTLLGQVIYSHEFTTLAVAKPEVTIENGELWVFTGAAGSQTLGFNMTVTEDIDEVAEDGTYKVDIYEDGVLKETVLIANPEDTIDFAVTSGDTDYDNTLHAYTVVVRADVDMNDVVGETAIDTNLASRTFINMNE